MDMVFDGVHHMGKAALLFGNENEEKTLFREIGNGPLSGYRRWRGSAKLLPENGPVRLVKRSSARILEVQVAEEIQTTPYERTEGNYSESWPEGASWQQYRARLPLWCRR